MTGFFWNRKKIAFFVLFILALAFLIRAVHLNSDPPVLASSSFGLFIDERSKALEARDIVFFGKSVWGIDKLPFDHRLEFAFTFLSNLAIFSFFGVGITQIRITPLILGLLSMILTYFLMKKKTNLPTAFIALILLAFSYIYAVYNRMGIPYTPMALFLLLAVAFYLMKKDICYFFSGILAVSGFFFSKIGLIFIPILFIGAFFIYLKEKKLKPFILFSAGFIISLLFTILFYVVPFIKYLIKDFSIFSGYSILPTANFSVYGFILNFLSVLWSDHFFILTSILLPLAFTYILIKLYNPKKIDNLNIMFISWMIIGLLALSFLNYRTTRHYLFLVIPAVVLSSQLMYNLLKLKDMEKRLCASSYQKILFFIYCFVLASFFSAFLNRVLFDSSSKLFQILVYPSSALILFALMLKLYPFIRDFIATYHKKIFVFLLIFYITFNVFLFSLWVLNPKYEMAKMSNNITEKIPSNAVVFSNACGIIMEQKIKCTDSPGFINTPEELRHSRDISDYILVLSENERKNIDSINLLNNTQLIQTYNFGKEGEMGEVFLYKIIKTHV